MKTNDTTGASGATTGTGPGPAGAIFSRAILSADGAVHSIGANCATLELARNMPPRPGLRTADRDCIVRMDRLPGTYTDRDGIEQPRYSRPIIVDIFEHKGGPMTRAQTIADLREHSERAWEMAVDTDLARTAECRRAAESALEAWDRAIAAVAEQDYDAAREALREARILAAEWGDDSDEREALELLGTIEHKEDR